ncbi:DUF2785 domain-containing protein [Nocardioides sp.]|uniref:DUF2785 domain-containing protein n=1 Tax=Nocardioides sp. TaxID=35761 RepID=UPI0039E26CA1
MATSGSYWEEVRATGLAVPSDRPLAELTAELTRMLGDPDREKREGIAVPTLITWIQRGVYDDLLAGLGDGMAAGLGIGLGERGTDSVYRRAGSAIVLAGCLARDNEKQLLPAAKVLEWGDRLATWLLRERDLRQQARAISHAGDALATLARSPHVGPPELSVILDVVADRVMARTETVFALVEPDRLAAAAMAVLRRDLITLAALEPWLQRLVFSGDHPNVQSFLRSLYLQLALAPQPPEVRADLILEVIDGLRATNPGL